MTHLKIEQGNNFADTEIVDNKIISKLYEVASEGLDETSNLKGRLSVPISYRSEVEYLTENYPGLTIISDNYAIPFEDPKMVAYLNSIGVGSDGMITEAQAAAATVVANSTNTEITKFNELRYFTNITEGNGGFSDWRGGVIAFANWTALEEIDISNLTSISHSGSSADNFNGCTSLRKVTASNKLTAIGVRAFSGCSSLEEISGLSGTISIYEHSFNGCNSLPDESFENVIFRIAGSCNATFESCNELTSLTFVDGGGSIGWNFCHGCAKLTTVTLPDNITTIGVNAFSSCPLLSSINLPETITSISGSAFQSDTSLRIENLSLPNLASMGGNIFNASGIKSVSNLGNVLEISNGSFADCKSLVSITIPDTVVSIGEYAFSGASSLSSINFPNSITLINSTAFNKCSNLAIENLSLPNLNTLGRSAFSSSGIKSISNLGNITEIRGWTFSDCKSLTSVVLPNSLTTIGDTAFSGCTALTSVTMGNNVTTLERYAFFNCGITNITLPNTLEYIGTVALRGLAITTINIPDSVITMDIGAFSWNSNLNTVIIGSGITDIGNECFNACNNVLSVTINATDVPTLGGDNVFGSVRDTLNIYVPADSVDAYKAAEYWSRYADRIQAISV